MWIIFVGEDAGLGFTLAVLEQRMPGGDFGALGLCLVFWTGVSAVDIVYRLSQNWPCFSGVECRLWGLLALFKSSSVAKCVVLLESLHLSDSHFLTL